jgi:hypothetical protein
MSQNKETKKKGRKSAPVSETKEQKFARVVTPRVKRVIGTMRSIQKPLCSNAYGVTQEQVDNIYLAIEKELLGLKSAFESRNKSTKKEDIVFNL